MNRNCPDSCANCATKAATRAGASMANSVIAACKNGRSASLLGVGIAGMIDCNCCPVSTFTSYRILPLSRLRDRRRKRIGDGLVGHVAVVLDESRPSRRGC